MKLVILLVLLGVAGTLSKPVKEDDDDIHIAYLIENVNIILTSITTSVDKFADAFLRYSIMTLSEIARINGNSLIEDFSKMPDIVLSDNNDGLSEEMQALREDIRKNLSLIINALEGNVEVECALQSYLDFLQEKVAKVEDLLPKIVNQIPVEIPANTLPIFDIILKYEPTICLKQ